MSRGWWLVIALAAVVLAGGGLLWTVWDRGERSGPVLMLGDDPRIFVYDGDVQTLISLGTDLPVIHDPATGCLYVTDQSGEQSLVLWPEGSKPVVEDGRPGVRVPGHGVISAGDVVTGGGVDWGSVGDEDTLGIGPALADLGTCVPAGRSFVVLFSVSASEPG